MCSVMQVVIWSIDILSGCTLSPSMIGGIFLIMGSYVKVSVNAESNLLLMKSAVVPKYSSEMLVLNFSL